MNDLLPLEAFSSSKEASANSSEFKEAFVVVAIPLLSSSFGEAAAALAASAAALRKDSTVQVCAARASSAVKETHRLHSKSRLVCLHLRNSFSSAVLLTSGFDLNLKLWMNLYIKLKTI